MIPPKWTPGPWRIVEIAPARVMIGTAAHRVDCEYRNVAQVIHPAMIGTLEANAHLIAAAPDLYEALDMARDWVAREDCHCAKYVDDPHEEGCWIPHRIAAIDRALAKARGEDDA